MRTHVLVFCCSNRKFLVFLAVYSSKGDQDAVLQCMSLGAADFWITPLRSNEVKTLWTRVWQRKGGPAPPHISPSLLGESSGDGSDDTRK